MARNFSGAATDRVATGLTAHSSLRTFAQWTFRSGDGGNGLGRLFARTASSGTAGAESSYTVGTDYQFERNFSVSAGKWVMARPALSEWHHIAWTFDDSSAANNPLGYIDAVSQTITEALTPSGTVTTGTDPIIIGNTPAANRNWDGNHAEFVVYDRILTAVEIAILMRAGPRALPYVPAGWWPLPGVQSPEPDWSGNNNHGTVTGTVRVDHPPGIGLWAQPRRAQRVAADAGVSGTIATTLDAFISAITGTTTVTGTMSPTLSAFTSAISGTTSIIGTLAVTLGAFVSAITGTTTINGTISALLSPFVSAIQGTSTVLGSMAVTLGNFIMNASGTVGDVVASAERVARRLLMFIARR